MWNPKLGEELNVRIEPNNYVDKFVCWKRYKSFQTFDKSSVGKICKDYLISFEVTITRTVFLKYLAKYAILRMEVPSNFYTHTPLHKGGRTVSDFTEYPICYLDEKKITGIKTFWKNV